MNFHLVTTALEESWPKDEAILFLGEWCRRYSRRTLWSEIEHEVLPYHWDDRNKLYSDYLYLQGFYEELIVELSVKLNQIHSVDFSLRYWRILLGPWLGYFIQILFDRWTSIHQALNNYKLSGTTVLESNDTDFVPNDMTEFSSLILSDEWNHYIYSDILKYNNQVTIKKKNWKFRDRNEIKHVALPLKQKFKSRILNCYSKIAQLFVKENDAFFLATYLPKLDEMRLSLKFFQMPQRWRQIQVTKVKTDFTQRKWSLNDTSGSDFETFVRSYIPRNIPTAYLEGFPNLINYTKKMPWPEKPKVIWTSNAYSSDDVFKAWVAGKVEEGVPFVIGQHGGGHGSHLWGFHEEHQLAICDYFLSWGWTEKNQPNVIPVGELNSKRPIGIDHSKQKNILLITCALPRQSYHLYSVVVSRQWLDYFDEQCRFVDKLPKRIQEFLTVRTYLHDYGWDQVLRWREKFPNLNIDNGNIDLQKLIKQSRINVSTYNATTFLESFSMDVPTVIYWNPEHWELRDSAIPFFNELKRVKIFHETPESAAEHVVAIWDDIDKWWRDPEVREVLAEFKERYCKLPDDLLNQVETALKMAITNS